LKVEREKLASQNYVVFGHLAGIKPKLDVTRRRTLCGGNDFVGVTGASVLLRNRI
jgi:hypothetical protein